jgi:IS5 family transposase
MKYTSQNKNRQLTLDIFRSSFENLDKSNRWVVLGDSLPWSGLERVYNSKLGNLRRGAGNKPARMVIGALIVKHKLNLSDEETIMMIQENPYMQYMCGLSEFTDKPIFDPTLFVTIRKRITIEDINEMTLTLLREQERPRQEAEEREGKDAGAGNRPASEGDKKDEKDGEGEVDLGKEYTDGQGRRHKGVLKIDATCANAEVRYPVDVDIIHDGCKVVDRCIRKICEALGIKAPRTYYKDARRSYLVLVKAKKKGGRLVRLTKSYMLNCLNKDLTQIAEVFVGHKGCKAILDGPSQRALNAAFDMYVQQLKMLDDGTHTCANRIVSIFQPHIRPIVRGKAKARTEFGAKIGVSVVNGYTFIDHHSWDAYNECADMELQVRLYKERFGCLPATILADKIYMNRDNRAFLKSQGIKNYCKPLGRPPKDQRPPEFYKKMAKGIGERNEVECSFGTGKRVYRADNIRAKLPDTADCWTGMCYFVKNVMKFLRELCLCLVENVIFLVRHLVIVLGPRVERPAAACA